MTNQTLAATVTRILTQAFVQKVAFDLHGLTVTGMRYSMVAKAVAEGLIECLVESDIKPKNKDELAAGTSIAAQYRSAYDDKTKSDAMVFTREDYGSTGWEERIIFHEATHAIFDLFATSTNDQTLAIEDESAAVLAEAHYVRLSPKHTGNMAMFVDGPGDRALKLVDQMMVKTGDFERVRGTYFLTPIETQPLRDAVAVDWHFVKYIDSNGIPSDATNTKYIYDGVNGVRSCYSCWASGK